MEPKSKKLRWVYFLIAATLCLAGILVMAYPTASLVTISYIVAVCATVTGVILFAKLIIKKDKSLRNLLYIFLSLATLTCGIVAFILPEDAMYIYPMFIGLFIIVDGAFKLHKTIIAPSPKDTYWWFMFWISCLTIVMGFLVVRIRIDDVKFSLYAFILGFSILICGIENFLAPFITVGVKESKENKLPEPIPEPIKEETEKERRKRLKAEKKEAKLAKKKAKQQTEQEDTEDEDSFLYDEDENAGTTYMRVCDIDDYEE